MLFIVLIVESSKYGPSSRQEIIIVALFIFVPLADAILRFKAHTMMPTINVLIRLEVALRPRQQRPSVTKWFSPSNS